MFAIYWGALARRGSFFCLAFLGAALCCRAQVPLPPATDVNGDPLPDGARARLGMLRLRQRSDGRCLAFAADGKTLATSHGNTVRLWQIPAGKELRAFETRQEIAALVFSPDGKLLATAGPGPRGWPSITVWKTAGGKALAHFPIGNADSYCLAFSPDGKALAALQRAGHIKTSLQIWDIASGRSRVLARFDSHPWVCGIAFAPDGRTLVTPGDHAYIWEVKSGQCRKKFDKHDTVVTAAVFHPDGKHLATGSMDGSIRLWDLATGKERRRWPAKGYVTSIAFLADGKVVGSGMHHHKLRVWTEKGGVFAAFGEERIALSPDGKYVAIADSKIVHLCEVRSGDVNAGAKDPATCLIGRREIEAISSLPGSSQKIVALAWSHDGKMIASAGGDGGSIILWDAVNGEVVARLKGRARALAFAPDSLQLALAGKNGVDLWDKEAPDRYRRITAFKGEAQAVVFAPDGNTISLMGGTLKLILPAAFQMANPRCLHLFNARTGKLLHSIPAQEPHSRSSAFSRDGRMLAVAQGATAGDGTRHQISVLDVGTGKHLRQWRTPDDTAASCLQFASRDVLLAALVAPAACQVCWWDTRSGRLIRQRSLAQGQAADIAFSADGRMLAVGDRDGTVRLWDVFAAGERHVFRGHQDAVNALAFSPNGKTLASGSEDTTGLVWDIYGLSAKEKSAPRRLDDCWRDLGSANAADAFRALRLLIAGQAATLALLKQHFQPVTLETIEHLRALAANLDDRRFKVRDRAMRELTRHATDGSADPDTIRRVLHACLKDNPSLELSRRVERLLQSLAGGELSPDRLRRVRALEVLERIAGPQAREILASLAHGAADAWLTREAEAALERLEMVGGRR